MVQDVRSLNRSAVLTELLRSRPVSRKEIAKETGISAATVTRAVEDLISDGIVAEGDDIVEERRGRRARAVDLVADRALVAGVDLGASSTRSIVTDLLGRPRLTDVRPTPTDLDPDRLAAWVATTLRTRCGGDWSLVSHVSVGVPGAVGSDLLISNAPNLPQIEDPAFLSGLRERLGVRFEVDNDANYALLGEQRFGAARHTPTAAMLTLGTGLGAALAVDGQLLRGRHGLVGEFGQLPVGPLGTRLEHMVTGPGILRGAAEANVSIGSPADLFDSNGSPAIRALRSQFDQALLIVLTAITVSCEPVTIVVGGGISKSLEGALPGYEDSLRRMLRHAPKLVTAGLGDFSGTVGACVASLHAAYRSIGVESDALTELPASPTLDLDSVVAAMTAA
jgi:glucokinase